MLGALGASNVHICDPEIRISVSENYGLDTNIDSFFYCFYAIPSY
jgi:hypothetical protein